MSPTSETGPLSTPPRANAPAHGASKIESTPNSRGASVVSENIGVLGVRTSAHRFSGTLSRPRSARQMPCCKPSYSARLVRRRRNSPSSYKSASRQFCRFAMDRSPPHFQSLLTLRQPALNEYVRPGIENNFYGPFIRATNIALTYLEEIKVDGMRAPVPTVDMICQQNDMPMYQSHQTAKSIRKPDSVILPLNSACASFEDQKGGKKGKEKDEKDDEQRKKKRKAHMDTNATSKPKNLPWKDVLTCIEFKRKTPGRTKGIKLPPSSYTVTDYVPTKPEYLPVDHLKPGDPASDTASAVSSSSLTAAQQTQGGSSSKRKAADTLESAAKKAKINPDELDVTIQTGLYAAEMFAANLAVNHLLNIIVVDDVMWIWYYDRQGTIQCPGINFIQDLPRFMVLLYALQRFDLHDWGRNKDFLSVQVEGKQCHEFKIKDDELGEVDLLLHTSHDDRVTHYGLQGRATNVVPVTSEALTKKFGNFQDGMVAKIFWGEANRTSEPAILNRVEDIAEAHDTVKDHIPELLWHHTFTNPTSAAREALGVPEPATGSRVLYILVFRKLHSIAKLHGKELFDVWYQCILCHVTLWKQGVYHRDVSPGNLMWYWKDGKRIGVLNDYDLSSLADDPGPRGNERTGTVPFMALELLSEQGQRGEVKHLYRHDLESFMWCFAWISLRYENGALVSAESRPGRLYHWATSDAVTCSMPKLHFLNNVEEYRPRHIKPLMWEFLVECFDVLDTYAFNRRKQLLRSRKGGDRPTKSEESESDIDCFLQSFKNIESWATLSKLLREPLQ